MTAYCKFCNKEVTKEECIECENGQYIHHLCNMYVNFDLRKVPKPYLKAIKEGKITQEKAWIDLQSVVKPELLPTREDFNKEFDRVKGGKVKYS